MRVTGAIAPRADATSGETAFTPPITRIFAGDRRRSSAATEAGRLVGAVRSSGPPSFTAAGAADRASGKAVPDATTTTRAVPGYAAREIATAVSNRSLPEMRDTDGAETTVIVPVVAAEDCDPHRETSR